MISEYDRTTSFRLPKELRDRPHKKKAETGMRMMGKIVEHCFDQVYGEEIITDSARMDWLIREDNRIGGIILPTSMISKHMGDIRAAIDEAMSRDKG